MSRVAIFAAIGGFVLLVMGWDANKLSGVAKQNATAVALKDLKLTGAADGNRHVVVSDLDFTPDYVYVTKRSSWESVWMPMTLPNSPRPVAILKSTRLRNPSEVEAFCNGAQTITGIITNDISSLSSLERNKLAEGHPGVNFSSLPVIEDRKSVPTKSQATMFFGGGVLLLLVAGVTGFLAFRNSQDEAPPPKKKKKRRREEPVDDEDDEEDDRRRPRNVRGNFDEDDEERPRRRRDRDEDDDEEERPRRRRRDEDDDYDDRPRRRRLD